MDHLAAGQQECHREAGDVHERHRETTPLDAMCIRFRMRIDRAKDVTRDRRDVEQPHAEKTQPRKNLHRR